MTADYTRPMAHTRMSAQLKSQLQRMNRQVETFKEHAHLRELAAKQAAKYTIVTQPIFPWCAPWISGKTGPFYAVIDWQGHTASIIHEIQRWAQKRSHVEIAVSGLTCIFPVHFIGTQAEAAQYVAKLPPCTCKACIEELAQFPPPG